MADLNILFLEEIVSNLIDCEKIKLSFDDFAEIIIQEDLFEKSISMFYFLKLVSLFNHDIQKNLLKKLVNITKDKNENINNKICKMILWCWNNFQKLEK